MHSSLMSTSLAVMEWCVVTRTLGGNWSLGGDVSRMRSQLGAQSNAAL